MGRFGTKHAYYFLDLHAFNPVSRLDLKIYLNLTDSLFPSSGSGGKNMRRRFGESLLFMVMIAVLILLPVRMASAEGLLERPKANTEVSGLVPFAFLNKIALKKAQERWGQVALGPPLACVDDDGDIVAYMFPFSIGSSSFPAYSEILSSVKEGRRIAREGFKAMNPMEQQTVLDYVKDRAKDQMAPSDEGDPVLQSGVAEKTDENLADQVAKKMGRQRMIGSGQYGTLVVSARYDRFPIPLYMHYLPPYFYTGDLAALKAAGALSTDTASLERIYFLDRARGQYFEFESNHQKVLVHSYSLDVVSPEAVLTRKGRKVIPEPEVMSQIDEAWVRMEKELE